MARGAVGEEGEEVTTPASVIFAAINALAADREFAQVLAASKDAAHKVVAYLVRRGVGETEAELLGLAYFAGRMHQSEQVSRLIRAQSEQI